MTIKEIKDFLNNFNENLEVEELKKPSYDNKITIIFIKKGE